MKQVECDVGVYRIRNTQNGRVYIGSSKTIQKRFCEHRCSLKRGDHPNRFLQNDWNKSDPQNFVFETMEEIRKDPKERFSAEQRHLDLVYDDQQQCYNFRSQVIQKERVLYPVNGYIKGAASRTEITIARHKERMARHKETVEEWVSVGPHCRRFENANLLSPDGILYVNVTNVQKFAETFGLSESKVRDVIKMKLLTYKGWSKFIDIEANRDLFERSIGKKYITVKVTPDRESVCQKVIGGQTRYAHRAWMKSPEGNVMEVRSVKEFCETHRITKSTMTRLLNGSLLTWKGWTFHGEPKTT